jgi:hypothetical protein
MRGPHSGRVVEQIEWHMAAIMLRARVRAVKNFHWLESEEVCGIGRRSSLGGVLTAGALATDATALLRGSQLVVSSGQ